MPSKRTPVRVVFNSTAAQAALKALGDVMSPQIFTAFSEFAVSALLQRTFDDRSILSATLRFWPWFCAIRYGMVNLPDRICMLCIRGNGAIAIGRGNDFIDLAQMVEVISTSS